MLKLTNVRGFEVGRGGHEVALHMTTEAGDEALVVPFELVPALATALQGAIVEAAKDRAALPETLQQAARPWRVKGWQFAIGPVSVVRFSTLEQIPVEVAMPIEMLKRLPADIQVAIERASTPRATN